MPAVSVIVPNYNHAKYLTQRIESILNQTYQDFELIILDDCSTDNSRSIISAYETNPKVSQVIYGQENSGNTFKQWKKGIDASEGTYIWIAESDDWCEATLLETLVNGIEQDNECVISYCQSYCINDQNRIIFQSNHHMLSEMVNGDEFIQKYISVPVAIYNASMALWRKDKFYLIPETFMSFRFCGDWYFWIQLSKLGKVNISAKILNYFRKHGNDVSGKAYKSGLNFIEELKIINMMYSEGLTDEYIYYRAFRKKFIEYWHVRKSIEKTNNELIIRLFKNPLSKKINLFKFVPVAIWKTFRNKNK